MSAPFLLLRSGGTLIDDRALSGGSRGLALGQVGRDTLGVLAAACRRLPISSRTLRSPTTSAWDATAKARADRSPSSDAASRVSRSETLARRMAISSFISTFFFSRRRRCGTRPSRPAATSLRAAAAASSSLLIIKRRASAFSSLPIVISCWTILHACTLTSLCRKEKPMSGRRGRHARCGG